MPNNISIFFAGKTLDEQGADVTGGELIQSSKILYEMSLNAIVSPYVLDSYTDASLCGCPACVDLLWGVSRINLNEHVIVLDQLPARVNQSVL